MNVYLDGRLCPVAEAKVSVLDRGYLFGDGVYEVVRCYQGTWFRMADHEKRLARSLKAIGLESFEANWLEGIGNDLLSANPDCGRDAILYLQVTRGADVIRQHVYPREPLVPTVFGMMRKMKPDPPSASVVLLEDRRWGRCDIKTIALLGHIMAANEASRRGADEAVLVRDGKVTEGSATNVAAVINGTVVTHPESPWILSGISRKVALEICDSLRIPVEQRAMKKEELLQAEEVFLMGTTHEVWPVGKIDGKSVSLPAGGGLTRRIQERFSAMTGSANPTG